jgi:hypothetical protein
VAVVEHQAVTQKMVGLAVAVVMVINQAVLVIRQALHHLKEIMAVLVVVVVAAIHQVAVAVLAQ